MLIPRQKLQSLKNWIDEPEVLIILGPRQVGKTTLMNQLEAWLKQHKRIPTSRILSFNLDLERDKEFLISQEKLAAKLRIQSKKTYVFIDEVQRLTEPGLFLKGLVDAYPGVKFIVSGSSSLEIRSKVADVLTGRKHVINLHPLSVAEVKEKIKPLDQLLVTGGYPKVFTTKQQAKKTSRLEEIVTSYLRQDVQDFLGVEFIEEYQKLLILLADQIGQLVNISRFSRKLNLHYQTVERYLHLLKETFIVDFVYPFASKPSIEIVKSPVPYFVDLGVRNYLLQLLQPIDKRSDAGFLFENLVYTELKRVLSRGLQLRFWRTKSGGEVDFVVTNRLKAIGIEVKYRELSEPIITPSMRSFIESYTPELFVVVNKNLETEKRWGSAVVQYRTIDNFTKSILNYRW